MEKTIKAVTKKVNKKVTEETIAQVVERVNAEATLIAENRVTVEKARRVNPQTKAPMTKEEYQVKYNIEGALNEAQLALRTAQTIINEQGNIFDKDVNPWNMGLKAAKLDCDVHGVSHKVIDMYYDAITQYFDAIKGIIVKKAFRMLQKHNIKVDIREIADMRQDGYTALWLHLIDWKPYKRVEKIDNTEVTYIFENPIELIEEFGMDKGAKVLFWVLTDRVQKYMRTQIFTETTNRDSQIEAIAQSNTVEQLQEKIKVAATIHNIKDRKDIEQDFSEEVDEKLSEGAIVLEAATKLDTLLSKPQKKLLSKIAIGEITLTDISKQSGNTAKSWKGLKEVIRQGGICADDMRQLLKWIVQDKISLLEAEQFDTFTKRGLATMLVRMSR